MGLVELNLLRAVEAFPLEPLLGISKKPCWIDSKYWSDRPIFYMIG
jgi:hypothetical protein